MRRGLLGALVGALLLTGCSTGTGAVDVNNGGEFHGSKVSKVTGRSLSSWMVISKRCPGSPSGSPRKAKKLLAGGSTRGPK